MRAALRRHAGDASPAEHPRARQQLAVRVGRRRRPVPDQGLHPRFRDARQLHVAAQRPGREQPVRDRSGDRPGDGRDRHRCVLDRPVPHPAQVARHDRLPGGYGRRHRDDPRPVHVPAVRRRHPVHQHARVGMGLQPVGAHKHGSPFVIEENLIITQGGKESNIVFTAWGQNANYISMAGTFGLLTCDNQSLILDDPKPYVIYGILVIDDCSLVFPKGAKIHIHGGIAATPENQYYNDGQIIVLENGKLIVDGTYEEPVIIQGDRLEPAYEEVEGQWGGIRIFESSKGSFINNAVIKNSLVGVFVDSAAELTIKNTVVKNTSGSGIIGFHSKIQGDNLLIYNNGGSCFQGSYGGNYSFTYSTFGSYVNQNEAIAVNNKKCLDLSSDFSCSVLVAVNPLNISLTNCIIAGASSDEILLDDFTGDKIKSDFTYTLKNSIVKVADLLKSDQYPNFFENCEGCYNLKQNDKLFLNQAFDNYKLDTMSVALDKALYLPTFPKDIIGKDRNNQSPDIGCFEF